jgi:hypothetical protein
LGLDVHSETQAAILTLKRAVGLGKPDEFGEGCGYGYATAFEALSGSVRHPARPISGLQGGSEIICKVLKI